MDAAYSPWPRPSQPTVASGGPRPANPAELARVEDRISFVYLEQCTIGRDANALTATDERGITHIPSAGLGVLMLGPGTRVTHQAMAVIADSGCSVVWVGEAGVRYYAHGRPIGRSTRLLERQAIAVTNSSKRLAVARAMYAMRFPDENVSQMTMQQLRGREGARVRRIYRELAERTGVTWTKRDYDPDDFAGSDLINRALSASHSCLYGVVHAVITALGCTPGLGFVHTGHDRSFVYDIADLYKAEISIPIAFDVVRELETEGRPDVPDSEISALIRRRVRDLIRSTKLLSRVVRDIQVLLADESSPESTSVNELWDERAGSVAGGTNYGDTEEALW